LNTYTKEEKSKIRKLMRATKSAVMHRKYLVISLHMRGYTNRKIAGIVTLDEHTVGIYINTYKMHGTEALIPKKSSGPPCYLNEDQEQQLYTTISTKTPEDVGFDGIKNWTAKLACGWVKREFDVTYSVNGMLDMFHRLKLSYTRPTYVLAKADPEKQKKFKEDFEGVKKTAER